MLLMNVVENLGEHIQYLEEKSNKISYLLFTYERSIQIVNDKKFLESNIFSE